MKIVVKKVPKFFKRICKINFWHQRVTYIRSTKKGGRIPTFYRYALFTLPSRKHFAHTFILFG